MKARTKREICKRLVAFVLCIGMVFGLFDGVPVVGRYVPGVQEVQAANGLSLEALKRKFPNNAYWNHVVKSGHGYDSSYNDYGSCNNPDGYTWTPCATHNGNARIGQCDCNTFNGAMQCKGFAYKLASDAYAGANARAWGTTPIANVKAGDILHYKDNYTDSTWGHWVMVTGVNGNTLSVGEANAGGNCKIGWNRTLDKTRIWGVTVYSAPYELKKTDDPVVINYTINTGGYSSITNADAVISGSMSPAGNVSSWGFYIGTDTGNMQRCTVAAGNTSSGNMTTRVAPYYQLRYGTRYYYKFWGVVNGAEKSGGVNNFTTTSIMPEIPSLKMIDSNSDLGIGDSATVSWSAMNNASSYKLYLYDEKGLLIETSQAVTGTKYAFTAAQKAGKYSAYIESYNEVGTKGRSSAVTFTVHPDVNVTFVDADSFVDVDENYVPEKLSQQTVHYGKNAIAPADPSHTGYTFKRWSASTEGLKEDTTIKAEYEINQYTVKYVDSSNSQELGSEKITYYSTANPVEYTPATGYIKTGYDGWDKDYKCITGDTVLYTCVGWYNENFPIYAQIESAVREYDATESDNEGYTVQVKLTNWDTSTTKGRVVVALKTKEGKLLTSTESSAFSMKKSTIKNIEIFVPYDKAASIAEVYVIGQYQDAVPITTTASNNATMNIDQSLTYTNWSTDVPPEGSADFESRMEYRYADKSTTTSYDTSLSGYIQDGGTWVQSGSGNIDYVTSFPSGFNTGNYYYAAYHNSPMTPFENATNKTTVSTSTIGYLYYHWCRGTYTSGPINRSVSDTPTATYNTFHAYTSGALGYNGSAGAFQNSRADICKDTYWWLATGCWSGNQLPIQRCSYTNYRKLFNYYKWSDFSDWSTSEIPVSNNRKVESRTVYRYQSEDIMQEDNSGEERTISGSLGAEFAGKEAALFIYKVAEASDYTNEYVAQTTLDEAGNYNFNFKLREEPSADTGDFTVVLGVEGTSTAIYLSTIEAPRKEYTVNFYNYKGEVISTQKVKEGDAAELPEDEKLERTGYTFTKWSDTNVNITEDKDIYAEYEINKYNVVFVDWKANSVSVKEFEYGAQLTTPIAEEPDEGILVEWDLVADGVMTVTDNLIVCTRYKKKTYDVQIEGYDGKVVDTQKVEYGNAVSLPELENDSRIFLGWENVADDENEMINSTLITQNTILCPKYVYEENTDYPKADVTSGEYTKAQTVTLSCDTAKASIYYTTDGSDPTTYSGILYTEPIVIDDAVTLKYYATSVGRNDSDVITNYYAVNYKGARSQWMQYEDLPDEVKQNPTAYEMYMDTGYEYCDTKQTELTEEVSALEDTGWKTDGEEEYTEYTDWLDTPIVDDGTYVGLEGETRPVYSDAWKYQYSHYVYTDGNTTEYAKDAVDGFECKYETIEFENAMKIAGFDAGNTPYFLYDGQLWFSQTKVKGQVQTGAQYRYRHKKVTYYKWSEYTLTPPAADETREYNQIDVCSYVRHNKHIVNLLGVAGMEETLLLEEGSKIDVSKYQNMNNWVYEGVYTNAECTKAWNVDKDTVTKSQTLYVKLTPEQYTVKFVYDDGTEINTQTIGYMGEAKEPEVMAIEGYRFVGWDSDAYQCVSDNLTITARYVPENEYATVSLDNEAVNLYVGNSIGLTAIIQPASKAAEEVEWSSDDEKVAVVSDSGAVTAVSQGTANITVKVLETGETAVCKVTVKINTDTKLSLLKNSYLSVDENGYLRGVKTGKNTVANIVKEYDNSNLVIKDVNGQILTEEGLVGTGAVVCLMNGTKILDQIKVVMSGDITGDGVINNRDVAMLARALVDKEVPSDSQILAGDVNGDGKVNNRDTALIARYLVGKEEL